MTTDFKSMLGDLKPTTKSGKVRKERTPEQVAEMPVYIRLSKAEVECLERYIRAEGLIASDAILTPSILRTYVMGIFEKFGVDWTKVEKTLTNPTLIRKS